MSSSKPLIARPTHHLHSGAANCQRTELHRLGISPPADDLGEAVDLLTRLADLHRCALVAELALTTREVWTVDPPAPPTSPNPHPHLRRLD